MMRLRQQPHNRLRIAFGEAGDTKNCFKMILFSNLIFIQKILCNFATKFYKKGS